MKPFAKGRPQEMEGGKRRNVYLDDASWARAVEIGNGNASHGIRISLARSQGQQSTIQEKRLTSVQSEV